MSCEEIRYLVENFHQPVVFKNILKWNIRSWTLDDWKEKLGNEKLEFRKNTFVNSENPIWERKCEYVHLTMNEFIEFQEKNQNSCLYFDYKYMNESFEKHPDIIQDVSWADFGYPDKSGEESSIWIGSRGAHTPCHMDTYGYNLIAQIYGRKQWIMFPPEINLKPTRVPYEESSVYSELNFFIPEVKSLKGLAGARSVILEPGDVLFLPYSWWHYVENLDTAISVNIWLPRLGDDRKRLEEALAQLFISQITKDVREDIKKEILNPNSDEIPDMPLEITLSQLQNALRVYKKEESAKKRTAKQETKNYDLDINIEKVIKENPNFSIVEALSNEDYESLLHEKRSRYDYENIKSTKHDKVLLLEKIINSFCNPETLSVAADKFANQI